MINLHPDRLFSANPAKQVIARRLFNKIKELPLICPHGHTDPTWFSENQNFTNPTDLLIKPDHYIFRMLYSLGIPLIELGIKGLGPDEAEETDNPNAEPGPKKIWQLFADHYYAFRGTPTALWFDYVFYKIFEIDHRFGPETADYFYDTMSRKLQQDDFKPRALFDRFNIEILTTTESPLDTLENHEKIKNSGWKGKVTTAFRPDPVIDPDYENFADNLIELGHITHKNCFIYSEYLQALRGRRQEFIAAGATSTDHGHPTAFTAKLDHGAAANLFGKITQGHFTAEEAELFRGHMLYQMAAMSITDGLVMQIHPGSYRNHNKALFQHYGRDMGADIPMRTDYVKALKPLLDQYGNDSDLTVILFTLDESAYSRELAPLAGHYPILKLGPSWWFHDSPEGMLRQRRAVTETAGFYNTVGFNDDTRAFLSIPARHDVARRMDCVYLAELVADHRLKEDDAAEVAVDLAYSLVKKAYKL